MEDAEEDRNNDKAIDRSLVRKKIDAAITSKDYDRAAALIEAAHPGWPAGELHDLLQLEAWLCKRTGRLQECIDLMRQARDLAPTWLPHLHRLAHYLEEAEQWAEAEAVFDELIRLSEEMNEHYFIDDARFGKMICLKNLNRDGEIAAVKAKITPGARSLRTDGDYCLDDFD